MFARLAKAAATPAFSRLSTQSRRSITTAFRANPTPSFPGPSFTKMIPSHFPTQTRRLNLPSSLPTFSPPGSLRLPLLSQQHAQFHIKLKVNTHKRDRIGYKSRPHHASTKRFWQTGSGKLMRFRSGLNHKRRRKTKSQLRRLNHRVEVPDQSYRRLTKMMYLKAHRRLPQGQTRPCSKYWQPPKNAQQVKQKRYC